MLNTLSFHEDNYKQIEFLPEQNYFKTRLDIEAFPAQEFTLSGFQSITSRNEPLVKIEELKIPVEQLNLLLSKICIGFFPIVKIGYGDNYVLKAHTVGYGFERLGVIVESNDLFVTNLWLGLSSSFQFSKSCTQLLNALLTLGTVYQLLLVDWDEEIVVRLQNKITIQSYLSSVYGFIF
jgi:hypothetical protein